MDLVELDYSYSRIIHDYYVRNWKDETGSSKVTIAKRAVLAYHQETEIQKNVDPVFKVPDDESHYDSAAKQWAHQIDKFFSPYETVKLPYSFGDYLVLALDEEYRKNCLIDLDRKRRTIVSPTLPEDGDMMNSVQITIKETSEAIQHLVKLAPNGLGDDSDQDLMRGRQELLEAIEAMRNGLAQLDHELSKRNIDIVD
ncbi:MAG TPA: hypothetical protein DCM54_14695 [Gammaproteobacteria bacterium]|nr:hypothetical protein [Gammaproteobacteria bacterium]|tara:strand:+ start:1712 stop:2305 length:594 start_codon:yes stop_codon:yes gene_type:complete